MRESEKLVVGERERDNVETSSPMPQHNFELNVLVYLKILAQLRRPGSERKEGGEEGEGRLDETLPIFAPFPPPIASLRNLEPLCQSTAGTISGNRPKASRLFQPSSRKRTGREKDRKRTEREQRERSEKESGRREGAAAAAAGSGRGEPGQDDIFLSSHYLILRLLLILRALPWLPHLSAP